MVPPRRILPPEILTPAEVRSLLAACGTGWRGVRDRALLAALHRSGLRVSEALALRPVDMDLDRGAIRVLRGKGGRSRTVGVDPLGAAELERWLRKRDELGLRSAPAVFCDEAGRSLRAASVRGVCRRLAARAGVEKRVHPHGFRHTHAAELREEGVDIGIISKQLGHRSIATTAHYLDHIAPVAVVEAISSRSRGATGATRGRTAV